MCEPTRSLFTLAAAMKAVRVHLGRSQPAVARRMGRTRETVSFFENGRLLPIEATFDRWLEAVRHDPTEGRDAVWIAAYEVKLAEAVGRYRHARAERARERGDAIPTQRLISTFVSEAATKYGASRDDAFGDPTSAQENVTDRRRALTVLGATTGALLVEAAAESEALGDELATSDLSPSTLEHLDQTVAQLGLRYLSTPLDTMLAEIHTTRTHVLRLLRLRHTLRERVRLLGVLGWLTGFLGMAAFDLGDPRTARPHSASALRLAIEVGDHRLTAWVRGNQTILETYAGQPAEAVRLARIGQQYAGDDQASRVRLSGLEARAAGRLGDLAGVEAALRACGRALDVAPSAVLDSGSVLTGRTHDLVLYRSSAFVWLRRPRSARAAAEQVLEVCGRAPSRWPGNRAVAHLDIATSHVIERDPTAACAAANDALDIHEHERETSVILRRAAELHRALAPYQASPVVRDFGDRLRALRTA